MVLEKKNNNKNNEIKGIGASPGITIGKAFLVDKRKVKIPQKKLQLDEVALEIERFFNCLNSVIEELTELKNKILAKKDDIYKEEILLLDMQLLLLNDSQISKKTIELIKEKKINAEWALNLTLEEIFKKFEEMNDPYISERKDDIKYVFDRVFTCLKGEKFSRIEDIKKDVILVGHDFSPAETIQMNFSKVKGFITEVGSKTSHTAIIARSQEIPAVVGVENITNIVNGGDDLIIDGFTGDVFINPDKETIEKYRKIKENYQIFINHLLEKKEEKAVTKDGIEIKIYGNIEMPIEASSVIEHGGEGIGLFRTEYLYLSKDKLPTEDEHFEVYKNIAEQFAPNPVVIRTLDIGGDKFLPHYNEEDQLNPAMGLRAIRFCFKELDIFKTQLKGILRASKFGNIKILFPMIASIKEIKTIHQVLNTCKKELKEKKVEFDENIEIGVMIEIPSSAIIADLFAKYVNFFSIGTNDLIQYTLAIDRLNQEVSYLYEPAHPAVLRLIETTIHSGIKYNIPVNMCGEMAGEIMYVPLLLALGIHSLSMNPVAIPFVKEVIRHLTIEESKKIYNSIRSMEECSLIEEYLKNFMKEKFSDFSFIF